jgi:hypothetical protein
MTTNDLFLPAVEIDTINDLFFTNSPAIWRECIPLFVNLYVRRSMVADLGIVLADDSIPAFMSETVSDEAARTWVELWKESTSQFEEFNISLQMLDAAVRYKESKGDRQVLLSVPRELRLLLEPLVGYEKSES